MSGWLSPPTYEGMLFGIAWFLQYQVRMLEEPTNSLQLKVIRFICAAITPAGVIVLTAGIRGLFYPGHS